MLAEQRNKRLSKLTRSFHESKAEKYKKRLEKLDRDRERLPVTPREQPHRKAAAEVDYYHPDSEDLDSSDDSSSSIDLDELLHTPYGVIVTDTENISGVDKDEYREKTKKKRKHITKPRGQPLPVLDRCKSVDRFAQEVVIAAGPGRGKGGEGEGTALDGGRG